MKHIPYTYLIGWSKQDRWYYGVQYASKNSVANPVNLWTTYFTSSKAVRQHRDEFGEPDVIQIRKIFESKKAAVEWEARVLQRLKAASNPKWINRNVKGSIFVSEERQVQLDSRRRERGPHWNKGRTPWNKGLKGVQPPMSDTERQRRSELYKGKARSKEAIEKGAAKLRGRPKSEHHRQKLRNSGQWDKTVYNFEHKSGVTFIGTRKQLIDSFPEFKVTKHNLAEMINGRCRTAKGWKFSVFVR